MTKSNFLNSNLFKDGYLPSSLSNMWITNGERSQEHDAEGAFLRNDSELYIPLVKYNHLDNSPIFGFPKLWNNFEDSIIKSIHSKTKFNSKLKKHFLDLLADDYVCSRLPCPHCHLN